MITCSSAPLVPVMIRCLGTHKGVTTSATQLFESQSFRLLFLSSLLELISEEISLAAATDIRLHEDSSSCTTATLKLRFCIQQCCTTGSWNSLCYPIIESAQQRNKIFWMNKFLGSNFAVSVPISWVRSRALLKLRFRAVEQSLLSEIILFLIVTIGGTIKSDFQYLSWPIACCSLMGLKHMVYYFPFQSVMR